MGEREPTPRPHVGDDLVKDERINIGDLAVFLRLPDGRVGLRRLSADEVDSYPREVFRVEPGQEPGSREIRLFRGASSG